VSKRVSGLVPFQGVGRAITNYQDPLQRRPTTIGERLQTMTPGQSTKVPPRLDAFGQPIPKETSGPASLSIFGAMRTRTNDPVNEELARYGIKPAPAKPKDSYTVNGVPRPVDQATDLAIRQAKGRLRHDALERVIKGPLYKTGTDAWRAKELHKALGAGRQTLDRRLQGLLAGGWAVTPEALAPR
jgi:hypothetical protein